jgi:CheY-like chemotaxis protein
MRGDPDRLQQIVWNLLSNAIKFTNAQGRVELTTRRQGSTIVLRVRDNGRGIDPAFLPHVFERFRQYDSSTTRSHGGLGLGLAIVRHLVELHGGTVSAESDGADHGASFSVCLPAPALEVTAADALTAATQPTMAEAQTLRGLSVLLVDDEPDTLEVIRRALDHLGASVTTASSAEEAMAVVERLKLDVVISDIGMPGADGYALMRQIRSRKGLAASKIPAVALTAYASASDRKRALSAGYQVHVPKPVGPAELGRIVARVTGRTSDPEPAVVETPPESGLMNSVEAGGP